MLIGIDAREIQEGVHTGIGRALVVFLDYFSNQSDKNKCILFSSKPIPSECINSSPRLQYVVKNEITAWIWDQITLPALIRKFNIDLLFSPFYKTPIFCSCPKVCTIFDLMYVYCEYYKKELSLIALLYLKTIGRFMVNRSKIVFTCSNYSKSEIIRFYGTPPEKIKVIYLGLDDIYKPVTDIGLIQKTLSNYTIDSDFILYTGNFKPHKNVDSLINAFDIVAKRYPGIKLVLAGAQKRTSRKIVEAIKSCRYKENILITGAIPIQDQIIFYSSAKVFVMPSLYEGFGYPPLEAMACGAPVISSKLTSLKEIVGNAGLTINPRNPELIAKLIFKVLKSPDISASLSENGLKWSKKFTSVRYAKSLYELLIKNSNT